MAERVLAARYELVDQLGAGAMATVWRARDRRLDREVAIKMLSQQLASDPAFRERFEREAIHVAALKHPNIVTVHDSGAEGASYYIVMEFVEGQSLQSMLGPASPYLTLAQTQRLAGELLAGLGHAHRKGIIHRDIKPANILVTEENTAKLADFGIARANRDVQKLTATGSFLGTPLYCSPEQLDGRPTSAASDLYSVGCVLYECLLGHPPFEADMPAGVIAQHLTKAPRPMRTERPEISPQLEAAVLHSLEKDPDRRFSTAEEMSESLVPSRVATPGSPLPADHPTPLTPSDGMPTVSPERLRPDPLDPREVSREPPLGKPDERRSRSWALPLIGAVIGLIALGGAGAGGYALVSNNSSSKSTSSTTAPPTTKPPTSSTVAPSTTQRAEASQVANLLSQNAGARGQVVSATQGVENCSVSPASGTTQVQSAINTRNTILNQLGSIPVDALPAGTQMVSTLSTAMRSSVTSDRDYIAWMGDVAAQGCPLSTATDASYQAAVAASSQATAAKQTFVNLWNPTAAQFGLQQYSESDL